MKTGLKLSLFNNADCSSDVKIRCLICGASNALKPCAEHLYSYRKIHSLRNLSGTTENGEKGDHIPDIHPFIFHLPVSSESLISITC